MRLNADEYSFKLVYRAKLQLKIMGSRTKISKLRDMFYIL